MKGKNMQRKKILAIILGGFVGLYLIGILISKYSSVLMVGVAPSGQGITALHQAAWDGRSSAVKRLLVKGEDVNCRDKSGQTPLHFAAIKGDKETVKVLIAYGANVNARDDTARCTPLHAAAGFARVEMVKLLLAAGADVNAGNIEGSTPLDIVKSNQRNAIMPFKLIYKKEYKKYKVCAELLREHAEKQKE